MSALTIPPTAATDTNDRTAAVWFAGGERVGYDPATGAVAAADAPLRIFLRREV